MAQMGCLTSRATPIRPPHPPRRRRLGGATGPAARHDYRALEMRHYIAPRPLPHLPGGLPPEVTEALWRATGIDVLCNRPYSGTEVIRDYGEIDIATGKPIVDTCPADSVLQVAAHEEYFGPKKALRSLRRPPAASGSASTAGAHNRAAVCRREPRHVRAYCKPARLCCPAARRHSA